MLASTCFVLLHRAQEVSGGICVEEAQWVRYLEILGDGEMTRVAEMESGLSEAWLALGSCLSSRGSSRRSAGYARRSHTVGQI